MWSEEFNHYNSSSRSQGSSQRTSRATGKKPSKIFTSSTLNAIEKDTNSPAMFALDKVQFQSSSEYRLVKVCAHRLFLFLDSGHLLRIDLRQAKDIESIDFTSVLPPAPWVTLRLWVDPTGKHVFLGHKETDDMIYLFETWKKPKLLSRLKGIGGISSFAFGPVPRVLMEPSTSTLEILIGTEQGSIYETVIEPTDEYFKREEKYIKQVHQLAEATPIHSIHYEYFIPQSASLFNAPRWYWVMFIAGDVLHHCVASQSVPYPASTLPLFESVFSNGQFNSQEVAGHANSQLCFYSCRSDSFLMQCIDPNGKQAFMFTPSSRFALLSGPGVYHGKLVQGVADSAESNDKGLIEEASILPINDIEHVTHIALTEFHVLLLSGNLIRAIYLLDGNAVFEAELSQPGMGLCADGFDMTFWMFSSLNLFEIIIKDEDRHVWEHLLYVKKFDQALLYAKSKDQQNTILTEQAYYYYNTNRFLLAASIFSRTDVSLEQVSLLFSEKKEIEALKSYLLAKIEHYQNHLHAPSVYQLLSNYNRMEDYIFFAILMEDYDRAIHLHFEQENYQKALELLDRHGSNDDFYHFSSILFENRAHEFVTVLVRRTDLNPKFLLPSLLKYRQKSDEKNQAIRYLEFCVRVLKNTDSAIHNLLLFLYAKNNLDSELIQFLKSSVAVHYDLLYALRVCNQFGKTHACVVIYGSMHLYEEAVDLALQHEDLELATLYADKKHDDSARRKSWLKIVKYVINQKNDIKLAMTLFHQSELLRFQDVLPLLPELTVIDDIRDELLAALEQYQNEVKQLTQDMEDTTINSEAIRNDLENLRKKNVVLETGAECYDCNLSLWTKPFYLFPCKHCFHSDCLIQRTSSHFNGNQLALLNEIQLKLKTKPGGYQNELDELLASDCPLCGEAMIRLVDQPFIDPTRDQEAINSWLIC